MRGQEEGEPVDLFTTSPASPASRTLRLYNYIVQDETIRYRIIVDLRDSNLSEKLQTDPELTIDKAITMARRTEAVREQQAVVRGKTDNTFTSTAQFLLLQ